MQNRDSYNLLLGLKSTIHCLWCCKKLHTNTVFRVKTCSYSCKGNKLLGASNELVHYISQLVISAWLPSSASYKKPSALPELRHTHTHKHGMHTQMDTYTQKVRNSGLWVASETAWPLQKTWGKRLLSPYRARVSVMALVKWYRQISGRNATWDHVRDNEVTFSCTGSKWQIDVNALTQTLFQTARVFGFTFLNTKERLPLLRLTNTACESFTQISCCW